MAEDTYGRLTDSKESVLVHNATHTDLYEQMDKITFLASLKVSLRKT